MCNLLFSNVCSVALSLVLFIRYFAHYLDGRPSGEIFWIKFAVKFGVLLVSSVVCAAGPKLVSWLSFAIGVILFSPFVCILVVLGVNGDLSSVNYGAVMADIPTFETIPWGVFISTLVRNI
jgi:hypothetical protein